METRELSGRFREMREIAKDLDRTVSTVSREVARHGGRSVYRANQANSEAWESALRPKRCLLSIHGKLQKLVDIPMTRACACPCGAR